MFLENIKLALASMFHNKMRTALSLLGIIIGVASVVAVMNLGQSVSGNINESLEISGINMVTIMPMGSAYETKIFDENFPTTLKKNVEGIDEVLPIATSSYNIRNGQNIEQASVIGAYSAYFEANSLSLKDGEFFTAMDNINRRQVCVIGEDLADDLFPAESAVGKYISIFRAQSKRYLVVGVLESKDDTLGNSYDYNVFIPYNTYDQRLRPIRMPSQYVVTVDDTTDAITVSDAIDEYLQSVMGSGDNYMLYSPASIVEMSNEIMASLTLFLSCIAGISLIVGGIGIMNIMLVSVVERTKEIGIRKALGARPKTIQGQFLVESTILTLFGGIIGILIGVGLSYLVADYASWSLYISWGAVIFALVFSMLVGIFFGWYPAKKAAGLDPIEALSRE